MSLASTLAGEGMRPASFLPSIKCSSCGDEIEIAQMGDHTCGKAPPSPKSHPASLSNPFTLRQMNASGQNAPHVPSPLQQSQPVELPKTRVRAPTLDSKPMLAPKPLRSAPPNINPDAANRPFLAPRPPRSDSPMSPALSTRSTGSNGQRPPTNRSATSPMPRLWDPRPPSPELSANLDCAFPPFPGPSSAGSGSRPGTPSGRKTPGPSDRAPSRSSSRFDGRSERRNPSTGGPLVSSRKPSHHQLPQQRRPSMSSLKLSHEPPPIPEEPIPRPSTLHANRPQNQKTITSGTNDQSPEKQKKPPPIRPERPAEDVLSPRFLNHLSSEPAGDADVPALDLPTTSSPAQPPLLPRSTERSATYPVHSEAPNMPSASQALQRSSTEPDIRGREVGPTITCGSPPDVSHVAQTHDRARSQSRSGLRLDHRLQNAPPVPKPVQQHKQERSHAPSDSGSSTTSSHRSLGNSSSNLGPSPISSAASSVDAFSPLYQEANQHAADEKMRVAALNIKAQSEKPGLRAEQPSQRSPPRNSNRSSPTKQLAQPTEHVPPMPVITSPALESPMDPAFQMSAHSAHIERPGPQGYFPSHQARPSLHTNFSTPTPGYKQPLQHPPQQPLPPTPASSTHPSPPASEYDPYRTASPQPALRSSSQSDASQQQPFKNGSSIKPLSPQEVPPLPPTPQEPPRSATPSRRGTGMRPSCRGCGKVIEGKSVKAADGRLTGRWHKACFTCRACEQPFTTADFYVIDNHPYCEQHYHEQNGSLCHGCHRGIEGQYLETTSSSASGNGEKKYHPRCFTCHDCRQVLSDDYFEISGRVYCERHALAAMRGQARMAGPGLNPPDRKALTAERRTTRLMMM
ncbi:hypothetical protein KC363_g6569 [Hortaea werneckii]|nr:hypothetical protein KC361_g842 [Hortaea werneckii]KAI6888841.1 hypothetical protein KC325_g946 [Hortaea werneckii]KAI7000240.1 hypothetical protein KC359_g1235 [Hortaea werneckii]KAI7149950.1 hypothetical protein KC344_g504 [Hortaea werneckii]KAI7179653.1 hypothetical protein KC360_g611 [Hortaea werneckii]